MQLLRGGHALVLAALSLVACDTGPEVVARAVPRRLEGGVPADAGLFPDPPEAMAKCGIGRYTGKFDSVHGDAGLPLQIAGDISFEIVDVGAEFPSLDPRSHLEGGDPSNASSFHANVVAKSLCVDEGEFAADITDGEYFVSGLGTFPFFGTVDGRYYGEWDSFVGTWTTFAAGGTEPVASGWWQAHLL